MDGSGCLFGTLQGNAKEVLHKFSVELPKKHGRGGQSALRFARLRMEKRHNYLRKVAEAAVEMYIKNDKVAVSGLVLAGSAQFKTELGQSDMFDQRLQAKIIKTVDISYGGESGFNEAIELAADTLTDVKFIKEKKLIGSFFDEISRDTNKAIYGVQETLSALEMGAVETLICWENLAINRPSTEKVADTLSDSTDQEITQNNTYETDSNVSLLEWLADNYKRFGSTLEIVSDKSQEGAQFVRGFGGLGGILRYQVEIQQIEDAEKGIDGIDLSEY